MKNSGGTKKKGSVTRNIICGMFRVDEHESNYEDARSPIYYP